MYNNNEMTATSFTCIILTINSIKAMPLIANVQFISQLSLILYDLNLYISNDSGGYFAKIVYILPIYQRKDCSNTTYIK